MFLAQLRSGKIPEEQAERYEALCDSGLKERIVVTGWAALIFLYWQHNVVHERLRCLTFKGTYSVFGENTPGESARFIAGLT